jgi:hypothetical protein
MEGRKIIQHNNRKHESQVSMVCHFVSRNEQKLCLIVTLTASNSLMFRHNATALLHGNNGLAIGLPSIDKIVYVTNNTACMKTLFCLDKKLLQYKLRVTGMHMQSWEGFSNMRCLGQPECSNS